MATDMNLLLNFILRSLVSLMGAFLLFPVGFVLSRGGLEDGEFLAGVVFMFFVQFISPFDFWIIPVMGGLFAAVVWQLFAVSRHALAAKDSE
jgi:hypothetical protein